MPMTAITTSSSSKVKPGWSAAAWLPRLRFHTVPFNINQSFPYALTRVRANSFSFSAGEAAADSLH
jgi:hypothetical protein